VAVLSAWINEKVTPLNTQVIIQKMKLEVFQKALELEVECYENAEFFNKYSVAINQSEERAFAVLETFSTFIGSLITLVSLTVLISSIEPLLLVIVAISVFISLFLYFKSAKIRHENYEEQIPHKRAIDYTQRVFYLKEYVKELRLFKNLSSVITANYSKTGTQLLRIINKNGRRLFGYAGLQDVIVQMSYATIMLVLAFKVFHKEVTVADFIALSNGSQQLSFQVMQFVNVFPRLYEYSIFIENYVEFMNYKPKISGNGGNYVKDEASASFENVSFTYPGTKRPVLNNISLEIVKGEKVAFVGRNGAGKTTLIKLISRLYDPTEGKLLLNGADYKCYNVNSLRQNIGIVFQDFQAFSITIAENILMRPISDKVEDERIVINALKYVGIYEKILLLPNGIYTVISRAFDDDGVIFSGGEMQKIAIARVYAQECNIVILDEPSSSLDTFTEEEIFKSILEYASEKTVILITHKLANVRNADKIFFVCEGRVLETGSHSELMSLGGKYAEMFNLQAHRFLNE
jgi:ATP-binding cassette subfamily B protein